MMKALIIAAHDLQLGYLGCFGNDWVATPHIDRLATEGIVFDRHYADCLGSQPRGSWSGLYQFHPLDGSGLVAPVGNPLAAILKLHHIAHAFLADAKPRSRKTDPLKRCVQKALAELEKLANEHSWLLWIDLPTLCPPWQVPKELLDLYFPADAEDELDEPLSPWLDPSPGPIDLMDDIAWDRLQFSYAAVISHLDRQIGMLLDGLRQCFPAGDVLICFMAESGLPLGEHGFIGASRPWLHEELVHLPMLIRLPGEAEAGRRVAALTQPVDLLPTLLDAFHLPLPAIHGRSLLSLIHGETDEVHPYACSAHQVADALEWGLHTPEWTLLLPVRNAIGDESRAAQLYVKPDDRCEVNNVIQHHPDLVEQLERTLREFVSATQFPGPFHPPALRSALPS